MDVVGASVPSVLDEVHGAQDSVSSRAAVAGMNMMLCYRTAAAGDQTRCRAEGLQRCRHLYHTAGERSSGRTQTLNPVHGAQVDEYLLDTPFVDPKTPHFIDIGGNDILALLLSVGCTSQIAFPIP